MNVHHCGVSDPVSRTRITADHLKFAMSYPLLVLLWGEPGSQKRHRPFLDLEAWTWRSAQSKLGQTRSPARPLSQAG
jgi:hypothetical protein